MIDLSAQARALAYSFWLKQPNQQPAANFPYTVRQRELVDLIESALRSAVQEALREYGQHKKGCGTKRQAYADECGLTAYRIISVGDCTCGLTALRGAP